MKPHHQALCWASFIIFVAFILQILGVSDNAATGAIIGLSSAAGVTIISQRNSKSRCSQ